MMLLEKEWYIQAPWGRICIIAWGDCYDPPVLVCHGAKDVAISFRPLIKLLPKKFYYIGMELPGCGKSDPMPPGIMYSIYDLLYSIHVVVKHFRWDSFVYMSHSFGCTIGKLYDVSYPGKITKSIDLDPINLGVNIPVEKFPEWYRYHFTEYFVNYNKYLTPRDDTNKYTKEEALSKLMKNRGLDRETAGYILERIIEPAGDGLIRFTFDQRLRFTLYSPFTQEHKKKILTSINTPTLTIICDESKKSGRYESIPFLFDEKSFNGNYRVREVVGHHDTHIMYPDRVASFVGQFLLYGLEGLDSKAKL